MRFDGKTVIVTGGGQGIGRAVSRAFASEGANVVIADVDPEAGLENQEYIRSNNGEAFFVETDVSSEDSIKNLVQATLKRYKTIDILINNAGISKFGNMFESDSALWDKVIAVNLRGPYLCAKYASETMAKNNNGCIVNIASTRAFMSEPDTEAYSASKGGIIALTHSLAVSLGKYKIRVNSISPGWIEISEWQKSGKAAPAVLSEMDHLQHPAGRVGSPLDIAKACLFLCSDEAGFITGTNLTVDGGMTIKMIYHE
ncbi:MAG: SDR family oxidoreductase [Clostridia bacterium]|nr:SDR family oxidoreductase [Clostridia bacterium]